MEEGKWKPILLIFVGIGSGIFIEKKKLQGVLSFAFWVEVKLTGIFAAVQCSFGGKGKEPSNILFLLSSWQLRKAFKPKVLFTLAIPSPHITNTKQGPSPHQARLACGNVPVWCGAGVAMVRRWYKEKPMWPDRCFHPESREGAVLLGTYLRNKKMVPISSCCHKTE